MLGSLKDRKVLVVEDEFLVAALIEEMLTSAGCAILGPIARLAQAIDAAEHEACDIAVLDVNLAGEKIFPVAEVLSRRNIPFLFTTGYGRESFPEEYIRRPRLGKPFKTEELLHKLLNLLSPRSGRGRGADGGPN